MWLECRARRPWAPSPECDAAYGAYLSAEVECGAIGAVYGDECETAGSVDLVGAVCCLPADSGAPSGSV